MENPYKIWCRQSDLNTRPTDYKSVALPLSYVGGKNYISKNIFKMQVFFYRFFARKISRT